MEEEKSFGRKLLGFFIEEDTTQTQTQTTSTPTQAGMPTKVQTAAVQNASGTGVVDKKFVDHFVSLLESSNLKGPDYFEYMQALKSLAGLGLSEDKQYQAAWASFKAMGGITDVSVLTNTANQYVGILDNDRQNFLKDVDTAISQKVGGLKNDLKATQDENEALAKQIIDLQNRINANNEKITKITTDISEQSAKITSNKSNYEITYSSFVEQIKGDVAKISQYLS
jgi:regulator of replication initiation timing